jgi:hypothetical protein
MENTNENGVVPFKTTGFPGGASSAKEAVIQEIASGNAKQNEMNQTLGGRGHPVSPDSKRSSRKVGGKRSSNKRNSNKRSSNKRSRRGEALALPHPVNPDSKRGGNKRSSNKRSSNKRSSNKRNSNKRSSNKRSSRRSRRKIHGGQPQAGQEVTVPQFQGDPAASELSGGLNALMLRSSQDAVHDKDINV